MNKYKKAGIYMKKILTICAILMSVAALVACGSGKPKDPVTYSSQNGWEITYRPGIMDMSEKDGTVSFAYSGKKDAAAGGVTITYVADKMPQEVLYDKIAGIDDSRVTRGEGTFGSTGVWGFTYVISPEKEGGFHEQFTGMEHNGGTLLLSMTIQEAEEEKMIPVSDAIEAVVDSLVFTGHEPQQQFSYVPGIYSRTSTDEIEGEKVTITETIELNEDHTGVLKMQDDIAVTWTSIQLIGEDFSHEYTIEGDTLLVDLFDDGSWISFEKQK